MRFLDLHPNRSGSHRYQVSHHFYTQSFRPALPTHIGSHGNALLIFAQRDNFLFKGKIS